MDVSVPHVPPIYTRNVLRAVACLQRGDTIFIPADAVIQKVIFQMGRTRNLESVKNYVLQALTSLAQLGVLARSPSTGNGFYQFPVECAKMFSSQAKRRNTACSLKCASSSEHSSCGHVKKRACAKNSKSKTVHFSKRKRQMSKPRAKSSSKAKRNSCNNGSYHVMCTDCRLTVVSCVKAYRNIQKATCAEVKDATTSKISIENQCASKEVPTAIDEPDTVVLTDEVEKEEQVPNNEQPVVEETPQPQPPTKCYTFDAPILIVATKDVNSSK